MTIDQNKHLKKTHLGINPQSLRGSKTGVYVGISVYGLTDGYPEYLQPDIKSSVQQGNIAIMSNIKSLYASRISFVFDLKGPSMIVDTACSSSMTAFTTAYNDMRLGMCLLTVYRF